MPNKLRNGSLLKWWLLIVLTGAGIVIANYFDGILFIYENDMTKLSFVIVGLFVLTSAVIGYKIFSSSEGDSNSYEAEWLISEHLLSLGLLGTVVGLLVVFTGAFQELDITNVDSAQRVLIALANGLGSAFTTTLAGLTFSMILKSQLVIAESSP